MCALLEQLNLSAHSCRNIPARNKVSGQLPHRKDVCTVSMDPGTLMDQGLVTEVVQLHTRKSSGFVSLVVGSFSSWEAVGVMRSGEVSRMFSCLFTGKHKPVGCVCGS